MAPAIARRAGIDGRRWSLYGHRRAPDRDALAFGVGLNAVIDERATAYIDYTAPLSDDQDVHALSGGVRVRF